VRVRHRRSILAALALAPLVALGVSSPVESAKPRPVGAQCKPAWKCPTPAPTVTLPTPTAAPTPTLTPTAAPTPTPEPPTPTPEPTPAPTAAPTPTPGIPAFGTRPASGLIVRSGGSSVLIENVTIDGGSRDSVSGLGIYIYGVHGTITIRDVDLSDLVGGIYIQESSGTLLIENVRGRNIGDGTIGAGHSNYIQLNQSTFSGSVRNNQFVGGRAEDMVSVYCSGGVGAGSELVIEDNRLQGLIADTTTARAWTSASGTGIIVGDGPGCAKNGHTIVRRNSLLTTGQIGIQHIDGEAIQTYENVIYGEQNPRSNNPMTSWAGNPIAEVHHNRYRWFSPTGQLVSPWWGAGTINAHDNVNDATLDPAELRVILP
jgi:hypothetical protein